MKDKGSPTETPQFVIQVPDPESDPAYNAEEDGYLDWCAMRLAGMTFENPYIDDFSPDDLCKTSIGAIDTD